MSYLETRNKQEIRRMAASNRRRRQAVIYARTDDATQDALREIKRRTGEPIEKYVQRIVRASVNADLVKLTRSTTDWDVSN
jgi:hypothetical protein